MKPNVTGIAIDGRAISWARDERGQAEVDFRNLGVQEGIPAVADYGEDEVAYRAAEMAFGRMVQSKVSDVITLGLSTADLLFRVKRFPSTNPEELSAMALNQIEKDAPLPIEEMVGSFEILGTDGEDTWVNCVAVPLEAVNRASSLVGATPTRIERVDAVALGVLEGFVARQWVGVEAGQCQVVFFEEGPHLTMAVLTGTWPLLIRTLGETQRIVASQLRQSVRLAFLQTNSEAGLAKPTRWVAVTDADSIRLALTALAAEFGCACELHPLQQLPSAAMGIARRTSKGSPLNLFPEIWREQLAERRFRKTFQMSLVGVALLWLFTVGYLFGWPWYQNQRVKHLTTVVEQLEPDEKKVLDIRNRISIINRYSDRTYSPLECLLAVSQNLPNGVILTSFRYNSVKRQVVVEGQAQVTTMVYDFMDNLKQCAIFGANRLMSGPTQNRRLNTNTFELGIDFYSEKKPEGEGTAAGGTKE